MISRQGIAGSAEVDPVETRPAASPMTSSERMMAF